MTKRWVTAGWSNRRAAQTVFRRIWEKELENGRTPGQPILSPSAGELLQWLVQGHPEYKSFNAAGYLHFTFEPDGRGNQRFVFVDKNMIGHPFSTEAALTGEVKPLRQPPKCKNCGGTLEEGMHANDPELGGTHHLFEPEAEPMGKIIT